MDAPLLPSARVDGRRRQTIHSLTLGVGLVIAASIVACEDSGRAPTPPDGVKVSPWHPLSNGSCPTAPCNSPSPPQLDKIGEEINLLLGNAANSGDEACLALAQYADAHIGDVRIGDYTAVTHWTTNVNHPDHIFSMTEIGPEFWAPFPPPPGHLSYILAHEAFHASQHVHMHDGGHCVGETMACAEGNRCAGTNVPCGTC